MMKQIKYDLQSEPLFERIWRGEWSRAGYLDPGSRDWGVLRRLGGLLAGSQPERWDTLFEILTDVQVQYEPEDSGKLFSIATEAVERYIGAA